MERGLFEIRRIDRENLPSCYLLAQYLLVQHPDGSHIGESRPQTFVMFRCGGEPNAIIQRSGRLVAKDENNFLLNIDREAAEHGASPWRQRSKGIEHKGKWNGLARLDAEEGVIGRSERFVATRLRHAIPQKTVNQRLHIWRMYIGIEEQESLNQLGRKS